MDIVVETQGNHYEVPSTQLELNFLFMTKFSDLTFITNEEGEHNLLERFKILIGDTKFFDVLVGYFRTSGFFQLYESLESITKIRILVGLNVDQGTYELIGNSNVHGLNADSSKQTKLKLKEQTISEIEKSDDSYKTEVGINKFLEFLESGKLEFRAYPKANIHSKVYISRFSEDDRDYGRVITGSSNFSAAGLVDNLEFNVELKNSSDVKFALERFEKLWAESVDITKDYVETVRKETWLNNSITPYEIYLKVLYEWFGGDLDLDEDDMGEDLYLPEDFRKLNYQLQAVSSALKILDAYNGVFLSDVVGLGKTFISALLARKLPGKKLVVCPPVLKEYWEETFRDFGVRGTAFVSHGKLDHVTRKGIQYDYVIVDEAHRFRNEKTQGYEKLHRICWGKKVILVSATPLNNKIDDIYSQLKLFQVPRKSTIPGIPNLEDYFSDLRRWLADYQETELEYATALRKTYQDVRDRLLRHVMVRRTRGEIQEYFPEDLDTQTFPEIGDPQRMIYQFRGGVDLVFNETTYLLKQIRYSRYIPLIYLKEDPSEFVKQSQLNIGGFMKAVLVKRLESSFYAFGKTVKRFISSYEKFIRMYEKGTVYVGKGVNILDYLDDDNVDQLLALVDDQGASMVKAYDSQIFKEEFPVHLAEDLRLLKRIQSMWDKVKEDPKLDQFICDLKNDGVLAGNKLLIFTESKETGDYLYDNLEKIYSRNVMFYSSEGGVYMRKRMSVNSARSLINENFDPNNYNAKDDLRILVTTDVLSEGTNLHRSNTVINYDLPWNPTKVMQRVGRINRLGTKHSSLYVYNFFPTSEADEHLGLKDNIKEKIKAFHEVLGEDAKYLTNEEAPGGWRLFGNSLYDQLGDKRNYEDAEEELGADLEYIRLLQEVKDNDPSLFRKIERLPLKARSGRHYSGESDGLITFFRKGGLKKFLVTDGSGTRDLSFFEAVDYFKCKRETPRVRPLLDSYYRLLQINKEGFRSFTSVGHRVKGRHKGMSNENYILKRLKAEITRLGVDLTMEEERIIRQSITALEYGVVPKRTIQKLKKLIEKENNPVEIVSILENTKLDHLLKNNLLNHTEATETSQIVLSQYLFSGG